MPTRHIDIEDAGPTVADVMMVEPKTQPAESTIAEARQVLSKSSVKLLLVVDGDRLVGTVTRGDLPESEDGDDAALGTIANSHHPRVSPDTPTPEALAVFVDTGAERVPVIDDNGTLKGLVCLNSGADHFCA